MQSPSPRPKHQGPPECGDEQAHIAGIADEAINPRRYQLMVFLDGNQAAEAQSDDEHWPQPEHAANHKEHETSPSSGFAINRPKIETISVCREIREQVCKHAECGEHHRLPRSSRSPGLRLPPLNRAAALMMNVAAAVAVNGGCKKNAAHPRQRE